MKDTAAKQPVEAPQSLQLEQLQQFFANPIREFLQGRRLYPARAREALPEAEPYQLEALDRWKIGNFLLERQLHGAEVEEAELRRLDLLPAGDGYGAALQEVRQDVQKLIEQIETCGSPTHRDLQVELSTAVLLARLPLWDSGGKGQQLVRFRLGRCRPQDLLNLWIEHLFVHACEALKPLPSIFLARAVTRARVKSTSLRPLDRTLALRLLEELVQLRRQGQERILPFLPAQSLHYLQPLFKSLWPQAQKQTTDTGTAPAFAAAVESVRQAVCAEDPASSAAVSTFFNGEARSNPDNYQSGLETDPGYRLTFGALASPLLPATEDGQKEFVELAVQVFLPMLAHIDDDD